MVRITFKGMILGALGLGLAGCMFFGGEEEPVDFWQPTLSPDQTRLAYIAKGEKSYDLFVLDLATNEERLLVGLERDIVYPCWSPDGTRIAFMYVQDKDNWDIFTLEVETRTMFRVTSDAAVDANPTWTPDGRILFNSNRGGQWGAYTINPDGTNLQRISFPRPPRG
ncbi:PD40 domain-containing protein [Candidatus Bipolaricaulota bacterium]|nr:PD40 domain-containing protein [Candidatus Bipolaricaulota bacterium]